MKQRMRDELKGSFLASAGWLFADMLLVLTILFLASTAFVITKTTAKSVHPTVTPVPKPIRVRPTSTPIPHLEQGYHRFSIQINANLLLTNDPNAIDSVVHQVMAQPFLKGRRAGLMISYGGAPEVAQIGRAEQIANKIYDILQKLGKQNTTFANVSRYDPLYLLGGDPNTVTIDIFLFAK